MAELLPQSFPFQLVNCSGFALLPHRACDASVYHPLASLAEDLSGKSKACNSSPELASTRCFYLRLQPLPDPPLSGWFAQVDERSIAIAEELTIHLPSQNSLATRISFWNASSPLTLEADADIRPRIRAVCAVVSSSTLPQACEVAHHIKNDMHSLVFPVIELSALNNKYKLDHSFLNLTVPHSPLLMSVHVQRTLLSQGFHPELHTSVSLTKQATVLVTNAQHCRLLLIETLSAELFIDQYQARSCIFTLTSLLTTGLLFNF